MAWFTSPAAWRAIGKGVVSKGWGGTKAVGRVGRKAAVLGTAGAVGMGVNPFLGAGLGKLLGGMGGGGKGSLGAGGGLVGAAAGAVGPGAGRDSSIVAGMKPFPEYKGPRFSKLSKSADFQTAIHHVAELGRANYHVNIANNKGIVRIQQMLQGPTAARAKELRMESNRALAPIIINENYFGEGGGKKGAGLGALLPFAALAGLLAGAGAGAARDGPVTGGGTSDILDKAWWDKPNNKYLGKRGTYWERLKAARFMSDFATEKYVPKTQPKTTLGKFKKWFPKITGGLGVEGGDPFGESDRWMSRSAAAEALAKRGGVSGHGGRLPGVNPFTRPYSALTRDGHYTGVNPFERGYSALTRDGHYTGVNPFERGYNKMGTGVRPLPYAGAGQTALPKGDGAVKVTGGKVTFPRLIIDWAPGGIKTVWAGAGQSISTTSKALTGGTTTPIRPTAALEPGFYSGPSFTQGRNVTGRRSLTAADIAGLRNAGLRVSAPARDGVRMIHEFDEGRWKTASKATINSVIGTQRPALLAHGTQFMPDAMGDAPRFSFDTTHQTRIPTPKTIPGGGAAPVETKIGSMPPGKGLTGYRGAPGTFGATRGRPDFKTTTTVSVEEFIKRANHFEASATQGMSSRVKNWLKKTFGKGQGKRNAVRGFNLAFYVGIVVWYAVRLLMVPKEGWIVTNWTSALVGEKVMPITKQEFYEKVSVLTLAFGAAIVTGEIIGAMLAAIGVALGIAVSAWIVVPLAVITGAIAAMIVGVAGDKMLKSEIYKKGGVWGVLKDPNAVPGALKEASKEVFTMIKSLWGAGIGALQKSRFWYGGMPHEQANALWKKEQKLRALAIAGLGEFGESDVLRFEGGVVKNQGLHLEGLMARRDYAALATALPTGKVPGGDVQGFGPGRERDLIGGGTTRLSQNFLIGGDRAGDWSGGGATAGMFTFNFKGAKDWVAGWFKGSGPKKDTTSIKWTGGALKSTAINPEKIYKELRRYVDHVHAMGILINIGAESSYRPEAYNPDDADGKPSGGLCQWHGSRFDKMEAALPNWRKQWQAQIKYIFTEDWYGTVTKYKGLDFKTLKTIPKIGDVSRFTPVERATMWWHYYWEVATSRKTEEGRQKRINRLKNYDVMLESFVQPTSRSGLSRRTESKVDSSKAITIPGHWRHSTQGRRTVKEWVPEVTIPPSALNLPGGGGSQVIINNITNSSDAGTQQFALTIDANEYNQFGGPLAPLSGQGDYDTSLGFA